MNVISLNQDSHDYGIFVIRYFVEKNFTKHRNETLTIYGEIFFAK